MSKPHAVYAPPLVLMSISTSVGVPLVAMRPLGTLQVATMPQY
jgi:hypothetical protein